MLLAQVTYQLMLWVLTHMLWRSLEVLQGLQMIQLFQRCSPVVV